MLGECKNRELEKTYGPDAQVSRWSPTILPYAPQPAAFVEGTDFRMDKKKRRTAARADTLPYLPR